MKLELMLLGLLSKGIDIAADKINTSSPKTCDIPQSEQTGTWLFDTYPVVGDCGFLGSFKALMINGEVKISHSAGCKLSREHWDSDSCTTRKTIKCSNGSSLMRLDWTISSDINNRDKASGVLHYASVIGSHSCASVYNFNTIKIE